MKTSLSIIVLSAALTAPSGIAQTAAPALQSTATSASPTIAPTPYSFVEMRYVAKLNNSATNEIENTVPSQEVRPTLGLTMFGERLDTSFTYIFTRPYGTNAVAKKALYNETMLSLVKTKLGTEGDLAFGPYTYVDVNNAAPGSFNTADVGVKLDVSQNLAIRGGKLSFSGYLQPVASILSQSAYDKSRGTFEDTNPALSLTDAEQEEFKAKDPTLKNFSGFTVEFKPEGLTKFSTGLGLDMSQEWAPVYRAETASDGRKNQVLDHHATSATTRNKFCVGYQITESLKISNTVYQYLDGYMQRGVHTGSSGSNKNGWENRVTLAATLF
jgi:hypothetical protein